MCERQALFPLTNEMRHGTLVLCLFSVLWHDIKFLKLFPCLYVKVVDSFF